MKHRDTVTGKDENMKRMVITAFFAAITFLGIQAFRIPLPAVVGTPFVHFRHISWFWRAIAGRETRCGVRYAWTGDL